MFADIPDEIKAIPSWIVWKYVQIEADKKPTKVPFSALTGKHASVNDQTTWASFEQTLAAVSNYSGIGFVFSDNDPFTFIDLDKPHSQENAERQLQIYNAIPSYAERSPSGEGLHIIARGKFAGQGRKHADIELYCRQRFATFTGDVFRNAPIVDCSEVIQTLHDEMTRAGGFTEIYEPDAADPKFTDERVLDIARNAANADKFIKLWNGDWSGYPSQSEADLSLINMLTYYSEHRGQVHRLFLQSQLGQRDKARTHKTFVRDMITKSFDRQLPPVNLSYLEAKWNSALREAAASDEETATASPVATNPLVHSEERAALDTALPSAAEELDQLANAFNYDPPPGLLGDIAQYIYSQAPRPVPEIALAGAIGMMAGICGQAYNISSTGLNQYILVLAMTGAGKEAMASGISKLFQEISRTVPVATEFIGPGEIASPQALVKYMADKRQSVLSIVGEFGLKLSQLSHQNANPNDIGLRRLLLDIYNKSGFGQVLRPHIYSDKANNTQDLYSPSFSLLGESTPERFYANLNEDMITEGLLPRFAVVEYTGRRPELNAGHANIVPSVMLVQSLASLAAGAKTIMATKQPVVVHMDNEALALANRLDVYADNRINSAQEEVTRQLWNRAHIKALKLAALIAVGINRISPVINLDNMRWAVGFAVRDINRVVEKFINGKVGKFTVTSLEQQQIDNIIRVIVEWSRAPYDAYKQYGGEELMHSQKVILAEHIQRRVTNLRCFTADIKGARNAIKLALQQLCEWGYLAEVPREQMQQAFSCKKKAYSLADVKFFMEFKLADKN